MEKESRESAMALSENESSDRGGGALEDAGVAERGQDGEDAKERQRVQGLGDRGEGPLGRATG